MEVHHHTHHPKKWKEYLTEFLMLFLAVTLGFFAENIREKVVESHRAHEYMVTMIQDLKEDTSRINTAIKNTDRKVNAMDSLIRTIYNKPYNDSTIRLMYYFHRRYMGSSTTVSFSRRTINQLVSSGNLRLIKNMAISDSIVQYDIGTEVTTKQYDVYHDQFQQKARELSNRIFDSYYLLDYSRENVINLLQTKNKLLLLTDDEKFMKEYANVVYGGKNVLAVYSVLLKKHKILAEEIIALLSKEYHIE
jgi:hypothetical protein